jgi:hypothetical protein
MTPAPPSAMIHPPRRVLATSDIALSVGLCQGSFRNTGPAESSPTRWPIVKVCLAHTTPRQARRPVWLRHGRAAGIISSFLSTAVGLLLCAFFLPETTIDWQRFLIAVAVINLPGIAIDVYLRTVGGTHVPEHWRRRGFSALALNRKDRGADSRDPRTPPLAVASGPKGRELPHSGRGWRTSDAWLLRAM